MTRPNDLNLESLLSPPSDSRTLHETVLANFNKTPSGKIYEKELKDIFCMMIICLDLNDDTSKFQLNFLSKIYPYTFQVNQALSVMQSLNVNIELSATTTSISYSIKPELGFALLKRFFEGKFLHCPVDRTRSEPKQGVALQQTAKGVALVHEFCKNIGMPSNKWPIILNTSYNSMDLFKFDRNALTDKILYSDYFLCMFFSKLMGPHPNLWSPNNKPDSSSILSDSEDDNYLLMAAPGFAGNSISMKDGFDIFDTKNTPSSTSKILKTSWRQPTTHKKKVEASPYHHRYFTNPESDSHTQYYVSNKGVRLYKDKIFTTESGEDIKFKYCVSGKAICQWLCDCTDIISTRHAIEVSQLLINANLLNAITVSPSIADSNVFSSSRNAFYKSTSLGEKVISWHGQQTKNTNSDVEYGQADDGNGLSIRGVDYLINSFGSGGNPISAEELQHDQASTTRKYKIELKDIINDPGMRYIFKCHLEKEFCSENLEAFLQLQQYEKRVSGLGKLLKLKKKESTISREEVRKLNKQIIKMSTICSSLAYNIYFTYLSDEAPFLLNIDYSLRQQITMMMINPDLTATKNTFNNATYLKTPISNMKFDFNLKPDETFNHTQIDDIKETMSIDATPGDQQDVNSEQPSITSFESTTEKPLSISTSYTPAKGQASIKSSQKSSQQSSDSIIGDSNVKSQDIPYDRPDFESPLSPNEQSISDTLSSLARSSIVFDKIMKHIYRLMESDSLPKFLSSDLYQNATSNIELRIK